MIRVLQVASRDFTVVKLMLPLIDRLTEEGFQVTIACNPGRYTQELTAKGYSIKSADMYRRITPLNNARSIWQLYRLMRREHFDLVHVHTPIAAALGRVAALMARVPIIMYTAHGFYFHENMRWHMRKAWISIEKLLGRYMTDMLFTQSREDATTAVQEGICPKDRVVWIGNGVDTTRFTVDPSTSVKESFGLPTSASVIGFIGPLVAEKGVLELLEGFRQALRAMPNLYLLVGGDTIDGERDKKTKEMIRGLVEDEGLASRVMFTGIVEDVPKFMRAIDLFVLPSHREGMPRTIIEAMASGKPVVATNIRGCREEVVHETTGLLVPVSNSERLSEAMVRILSDPSLARRMGNEGRRRAETLFDERDVLDRQLLIYRQLVKRRLNQSISGDLATQVSTIPYVEGLDIPG